MKKKEQFKKISNKVLAGGMVIALAAGSIAGCGSAAENQSSAVPAAKQAQDATKDVEMQALLDQLAADSEHTDAEKGKEETVYLFADSEGNVTSTIVSGWLKNPNGEKTLTDITDLSDLVNVKGDETYQRDGENYIWQADGHDIYYQGTTKKAAPVTEKITYYLDGVQISPKELAGKSGHVKIRFDFENNQTVQAKVSGKEEEIHVPFAVVTGMILNDHFRNITVENGRLVSDGKNNIVVGFALPGLKESLKLDEEKEPDLGKEVRVPDYVEVSADVVDFALDMTLTVAASSSDLSFEDALDFSDLDDKIDTLTDSSVKLKDGTTELADGITTLKDSMGEFSDGVASLKDGIADYTDGAGKLGDGIAEVKDGAEDLDSGAGTLADGIDTLDSGAGDLVKGINTAKDGAGQLADGINGKDGAKSGAKQVADGAAALKAGFEGEKGALAGAKQIAAGTEQMGTAVKTTMESTLKQVAQMKQALLESEADVVRQVYLQAGKAEIAQSINASNVRKYVSGLAEIENGLKKQIENAVQQMVKQTAETAAEQAAEQAKEAGYKAGYEAGLKEAGTISLLEEDESDETEETEETIEEEQETDGEKQPQKQENTSEQEETVSGSADREEKENDEEIPAESEEKQQDDAEKESGKEPEEDEKAATSCEETSREEPGTEASETEATEFAYTVIYRMPITQAAIKPTHLTTAKKSDYEVVLLDSEQENDVRESTEEKKQDSEAAQQEAMKQLEEGLEKLAGIGNAIGAVNAIEQVLGQLESAGASMDPAQLEAMSEKVDELVGGAKALSAGIDQLYAGTVKLSDGAAQLNDGMNRLGSGADTLADGMKKLGEGGSDLKDGTEKLKNGSGELKDGTRKLKDGANELLDGAKELTDNSGKLLDGVDDLADGTEKIVDGVDELHGGAGELLDGMIRFDRDGIEKIADAYHNDVKSLTDRVKAVSDAGSSYDNFCGKAENGKSSVKFIIKTEAIKE